MLSRFKQMILDIAEQGENLFNKVKDRALFKRVVQASFLIAIADGDFDSDEKKALAGVIKQKLPQFEISDILEVLDDCQSLTDFSLDMGTAELMDNISKARNEDSEMIVRIACYIGAADGDFDPDERAVAKDMCTRMGLVPSLYGL